MSHPSKLLVILTSACLAFGAWLMLSTDQPVENERGTPHQAEPQGFSELPNPGTRAPIDNEAVVPLGSVPFAPSDSRESEFVSVNPSAYRITGRLIDQNRFPVEGAEVRWLSVMCDPVVVKTDTAGCFVLRSRLESVASCGGPDYIRVSIR